MDTDVLKLPTVHCQTEEDNSEEKVMDMSVKQAERITVGMRGRNRRDRGGDEDGRRSRGRVDGKRGDKGEKINFNKILV